MILSTPIASKPATTEDFKAIVEKHITPAMDLEHNHKMDWFFDEYVYGTDLPHYHFESQISTNADQTTMHFKLTQSGVPDNFKMPVPLYLELADGRVIRAGVLGIGGNTTIENTTPNCPRRHRLSRRPRSTTCMMCWRLRTELADYSTLTANRMVR